MIAAPRRMGLYLATVLAVVAVGTRASAQAPKPVPEMTIPYDARIVEWADTTAEQRDGALRPDVLHSGNMAARKCRRVWDEESYSWVTRCTGPGRWMLLGTLTGAIVGFAISPAANNTGAAVGGGAAAGFLLGTLMYALF